LLFKFKKNQILVDRTYSPFAGFLNGRFVHPSDQLTANRHERARQPLCPLKCGWLEQVNCSLSGIKKLVAMYETKLFSMSKYWHWLALE